MTEKPTSLTVWQDLNREEIMAIVQGRTFGEREYMRLLDLYKHKFWDDKEVVIAMLNKGLMGKSSSIWKCASQTLRNDKEVAIVAAKKCGSLLPHFPKHLRKDKEVVLAALSEDPHVAIHACPSIQSDPDIIAASKKPHSFKLN